MGNKIYIYRSKAHDFTLTSADNTPYRTLNVCTFSPRIKKQVWKEKDIVHMFTRCYTYRKDRSLISCDKEPKSDFEVFVFKR